MSDNLTNGISSGNFQRGCDEPGSEIRRAGKRRLVEECEVVSVRTVQDAFGKRALIQAVRQARPVRFQVLGGFFDVWLVSQSHRLPGTCGRWSSIEAGNCRLWLQCPRCRHVVAKLFYYVLASDSPARSGLLCRLCHGLTYQSKNCGSNAWYREVARPLKRLLRVKQRLIARKPTPCTLSRLAAIADEIQALHERAKPKTERRQNRPLHLSGFGQRRPYRNLGLLEQHYR